MGSLLIFLGEGISIMGLSIIGITIEKRTRNQEIAV